MLPDIIVALVVAAGALFQFLNYKRTGKLTSITSEVASSSARMAKKVAPQPKTANRLFLVVDGKEVDVTDLLVKKEVEIDD